MPEVVELHHLAQALDLALVTGGPSVVGEHSKGRSIHAATLLITRSCQRWNCAVRKQHAGDIEIVERMELPLPGQAAPYLLAYAAFPVLKAPFGSLSTLKDAFETRSP
jgi:hypothetical protein